MYKLIPEHRPNGVIFRRSRGTALCTGCSDAAGAVIAKATCSLLCSSLQRAEFGSCFHRQASLALRFLFGSIDHLRIIVCLFFLLISPTTIDGVRLAWTLG
jgi:hypothetical protein